MGRIIFFTILLAGAQGAFAQELKARAVEPVRVSIETESESESPDDQEFHRLFRAELNKLRDVAVRSNGYDIGVFLTATKLIEKNRFVGYAVAVLTVAEDKHGRDRLRFEIVTSPRLEDAARYVAATVDKEVFQPRRK